MENYLDTNKSIIISAPAGSGKTEKLSRRYIALLQSGVDVERILAITFTDKAAAEMKQRILRILKEEDRDLYIKLLERMPMMRVTTIHSFCGTLIRRFSFEAAVDPNYRIDDAVESRMIWEEILYEILMDAGRGDSGHELFFETLSEKGFRGLDYLKSTVDYLYQKNPFSLEASTYEYIPQDLSNIVEELKSWQGVRNVLENYEASLEKDDVQEMALIEKYFLTDSKEPRKRPVPSLKNITDYRDWSVKMHMLWKDKKIRRHLKRTERIREIYRQCLDKYSEKKRAKGTLDFSDLEYLAYRMLTDDPEWANILYAFDEKTDHILVDEFQDTNSFQWQIINKLTEEWRSGMGAKREEGTRPTIFFVGDEKQSIYYFRGANVEIFSRAKDKLQEWLGEEFCYEEVRDNYRSLPAIIEFTNHVFSRIMESGEKAFPWTTNYTTFNAYRTGEPDRGRVELILTDNEDDNILDAKQKEAEVLAWRIRGLAGNYQITDRSAQNQRPCKFMDMAVLLRKRTHLKIYEEAFRKYKIPYVAVKGIGFYQEPEVAMLRAFIFFLSDPADDYSLYVLLKSPLFQMEETDIIDLINGEGNSLFEKMRNNINTVGAGSPRHYYTLLQEWLSQQPNTMVAELIEQALVRTKAWIHLHEAQSRANVRKFIKIVEDLEANGKSLIKIRDFLERTGDKKEEPKANVNTEGMDAVRIMTIHASKGLEFPVVFVPGLEEPFSSKTGENLVYEKNGKFYFKSEPESSIRKQDDDFLIHQAKEEEEQKRLFYVTVTRAEEALFLLGRWSDSDKNFLSFLKQGLGLIKTDSTYTIDADIQGLSLLTEEDVKMLYEHAPGHEATVKALPPVNVIPLTVQKQAPWKAVTETVEIKRQHGKDWAALGEIIHRIFEGVSNGIIKEEDIRSRAEKMLESAGFYKEVKEEKTEVIEKDIELLKTKGVWQSIILQRENSFSELPFVLGHDDVVYTGRIDRIIVEDGIYKIYDYKTFPVKEKEVEYLLKKYTFQMNIYKQAVRKLFNTNAVKSFIVFTHMGEIHEV